MTEKLSENKWISDEVVKILEKDGVVVMPTDTLYGIVGRAESELAVSRIYAARKRNPEKPCIILIGQLSELGNFSIALSEQQEIAIKEYWPGPVSIILDCPDDRFSYLHRGTYTLAIRMPAPEGLRDLLNKVGSLVAPSANIEGMPPAANIEEAKKYFEDSVDLYVDRGELSGKPSKLIKLHTDGSVSILRE